MPIRPFEFKYWRPDLKAVNSDNLRDIINAVPHPTGFEPVGELVPQTAVLPNGPSKGSASIIDQLGSGTLVAGTTTDLYTLEAGEWIERTRTVGGKYTLQEEDRWRFTGYNNFIYATSLTDDLQQYEMGGAALNFSDAVETGTSSIPKANYIGTFGPFMILGYLSGPTDGTRMVRWSGINDPLFWDVGTNQSGEQLFTEGGPVTGLISGEVGYVLLQDKVWQFTYQPGSPFIFQIDEIENNRGCIAPDSLVHTGRNVFFYSAEGFLQLLPDKTINIGADKVNEFFLEDARSDRLRFVKGAADPNNTRVFWSYVSNENSGTIPDKIIVYDWSLQEWGKLNVVVTDFLSTITQGRTLDELDVFGPSLEGMTNAGDWADATSYAVRVPVYDVNDIPGTTPATAGDYVTHNNSVYHCVQSHTSSAALNEPGVGTDWESYWFDSGNLDLLPASLDSAQWAGGDKFIGAFDINDQLGVFTGNSLEAQFETNDFILTGRRSYIRELTPLITEAYQFDTGNNLMDSIFADVGAREKLAGPIAWSVEHACEFNGQVPIHKSGKYVRARIRVRDGANWDEANGFLVEFEEDGKQ